MAAAAIGLCQSEDEPYFALFSSETYAANGHPRVSLSAWHVDSLDFRVYRVADPVEFFQQLEDPHQFGGRAARPPHERTLLESIHMWKRELRADIRRSLRAQFTDSPSAHFESWLPKSVPSSSTGTHYAEAPLLNASQLALSFHQPVHGHSRWERAMVDIGVHDKGVYLVEAAHGDLRAYTILMVSDIAMITKTAKGRVVNLVVSRGTGQPVADAKVALLARDTRLGEAQTNNDGFADMPLAPARRDDIRVVAHVGGDFAVSTLAEYAFDANGEQWTGYLYTDRPVYRPGHNVHFKGILRLATNNGYAIPAGRSVSVTIQDSEQKPVYRKTLVVSASGAIHDDLELPAGAALGFYNIEAKSGEAFMNGNFEVQEYKKPEYEVLVVPAKARLLQGDTIQATIDARYYFGEPVNGAKVTYAVYRTRYHFPLWYDPDDDTAEPPDPGDDSDAGDQVGETKAQLDADGKLSISLPTPVSERKWDFLYRIEARVTDQGNREITGRGHVVATYGSFAVNVEPQRYFYVPGDMAAFTVQVRDYDNNPIRTAARVELLTNPRRAAGDGQVKAATDVTTRADGNATASFILPPEGGSYRVRVTARTPEGRDVEEHTYLWVSAGAGGYFEGGPNRTVAIVPDKKSYQAGDTVRLMIATGQPNTPVFISVEGRDLREYRLIRSAEATAVFEIPVSVNDEPGITVNASFIRNGDFYSTEKWIKVPPVDHQLHVAITTDKPQYLPGQTANYSLSVTDDNGRPAPRAEFSLGVVDEAIYAIRKDTTQDILSVFYARQWNRVFTGNSLNYYFNGEAGKRHMRLAELRPESRLAQLKPERLVQPKVRKAFPDTAFWAAEVVTDSAGQARAKVEFPDSLTTWRATARGVTPDTKVGSATLKTIVRKNLILRLAVPRFFVQGDEVIVSALVHNYLATAKKARVSLSATGLDIISSPAASDVQIPSRGQIKLDWRVRAKQTRTASITAKALTDEQSDALQLDLPVNVPGVKLAHAQGGSITGGGSQTFDLTFPDRVQPGSRSLSVQVSPSLVGSLFGALDYLTSFPYGCVEQTMSSFLPNVSVRQAVRDLGLRVDLDQPALQEKIRAGLDRLYNFQHPDGGWGWWETDDSHPFMTAYVVAGLKQAQAAGVEVKPDVIRKGSAWLRKSYEADPLLASDLRAYIQYALSLAGLADAAALGDLYDQRTKLSPYGLAILGLAMEQARDGRVADIASDLERSVQQDQEQAWWTATRDSLLDFSADATPEATAYAVKLLSHYKRDSALLPKAALWLMNHRNEGYWWSSTKQTAMVIYGLTDYLKATNELNPNLNVTVSVNNGTVMTRKFDQATGIVSPEWKIEESGLQPGVNHVRIAASGAGRLYYSVRVEYYTNEVRFKKVGAVSLNILRDYFLLTPTQENGRIVYDTPSVTGPVTVGDVIAVRLTVTGSDWRYVMIEDPIPAGTEFIERDNAYELKTRPAWWEYWFTRRELHDDRMAIFQTYSSQGQHEYFYLLKVVNPGLFQVGPARVAPMYQRDIMATTESRTLEVK
jgi:uncharacterized protein YfaS (alpha-2-macroglobulin family)